KYLYSDWRTEMNNICAISKDRIMYGTLKFSNDPEDLWDSCDYLYLDEWFTNTNFNKAYIVLSSDVLNALDEEYSYEYKKEFFSNTQLVHTFELENNVLYFYKGSEKMFQDMIK
ncbi:MAG: hypothetical protein UHD05_06110, partial [Ruminococcus sp.]|nr:hypothetical protein [Ruminococcus sp.]